MLPLKKALLLVLSLWMPLCGHAQAKKYSAFYYQRASLFEALPVSSQDIVFLGNSITNGAEWAELFGDCRIKNRGISGDICMGVYDRLSPILKGKPAQIFLLIGINDVGRGTPADTIVAHIGKIVRKIKRDSPRTRLYLQSLLPVSDDFQLSTNYTSRRHLIPAINRRLQSLAQAEGIAYIDLYTHFADSATEELKPVYSNDGLHLLGSGYLKWVELIRPYIQPATTAQASSAQP